MNITEDESAHQVLAIVAESGYLAPRDLFICQEFCPSVFVSFEQKAFSWKKTSDRLQECQRYSSARVGSRKTFNFEKNEKLYKLACTTYAKQKLKLSDEDLKPLDFEMLYVKAARSYFRFYKRKDLFKTMLLKYGLDYIPHYDKQGNFDYIILPRCHHLYKERMEYLMHVFSFLDDIGFNLRRALFIRQNVHTRQFLQNGKDKKKMNAYANRLCAQNTYSVLKRAFPMISSKEISRLCEKMYDDPDIDTKTIIDSHTIDMTIQHHVRVRMQQISSSPLRCDLHRIVPISKLYDVHEDFTCMESYVQAYIQREKDIKESPLQRYFHSYVCPYINEKTLEIPMHELILQAQKYIQREEDLKKMEFMNEIKMRFPVKCMDLNVSLASLEQELRDIHDRSMHLEAKLREKNLELRGDSMICRDFIEKRRDDVEEVVAIMEEMHWFFTFTGYKYIIQDYYAEMRYYNSDSDDEIEWKSRGEISHECKKIAFRRFWQLRQRSLEEFDAAKVKVNPTWSTKKQEKHVESKKKLWMKIQKVKNAPIIERICQKYG